MYSARNAGKKIWRTISFEYEYASLSGSEEEHYTLENCAVEAKFIREKDPKHNEVETKACKEMNVNLPPDLVMTVT